MCEKPMSRGVAQSSTEVTIVPDWAISARSPGPVQRCENPAFSPTAGTIRANTSGPRTRMGPAACNSAPWSAGAVCS